MPGTGRKGITKGAKAGIVLVVLLVLAAAVYGLYSMNGGAGKTQSAPSTVQVVLPAGVGSNTALNFSPARITVVVGVNNTVQWVNQDSAAHTVTATSVPSGAAMFTTGNSTLGQGRTFTVTLTVPGAYMYKCSIHPAWMQAEIVVKQAA